MNALELSEFKAVLAHEFGHFAQSSMKLGQYVYVANQVIADLVFERDFGTDARAVAAHRSATQPSGLGPDRRRLGSAQGTRAHVPRDQRPQLVPLPADGVQRRPLRRSPHRQRRADLGFWKTERASIAYQLAQSDLVSIAHHGKYTNDLFYHHEKTLGRIDKVLGGNPSMRERFAVLLSRYQPGAQVHFQESGERAASMWATHPSNRDREVNAKRVYVAAPVDPRPAWTLLRKPKRLRRELTAAAYEAMGKQPARAAVLPAAEVHALITEERAEMEQADHYHGLYDDRVLAPGDLEKLSSKLDRAREDASLDLDALRTKAQRFTGTWLRETMDQRRTLLDEAGLLSSLSAGTLKPKKKTFTFRDAERTLPDVPALLAEVDAELASMTSKLGRVDRAFFRYFYARSGDVPERRTELWERYEFLLGMQQIVVALNQTERALQPAIRALQSGKELTQGDIQSIAERSGAPARSSPDR